MSHVIAAGDDIIRTPDQRLRVFVSSTLGELAAERAVVRAAIERLHLIPVMFELGARPHPPRNLYRAYLAQSHVFVGIYWERYGWVAPGEAISGLEDEYLLAEGLPQLLYIKQSTQRQPRLEDLLERIRNDDRASYRHFTTAEELAQLVQDDLAVLLTERFERASTDTAAATGMTRSSAPPIPLTETVGRDDEIAEVAGLVADQRLRLVTITGPGGIGKSRLALEIARRVRDAFPDGVQFVPLEPLSDAAAVLRAIADRLGIVGEGLRPLEALLAAELERRRMLLLLDNFEHVIDAAPQLAALLDLCPGVQTLVTSRRPLRLRGEHEYPLQPLEVPDEGRVDIGETAGVRLFVQRARGVRPDFELTADNSRAVAELVRRLDGLPLAIELAAARTRLFAPATLLDRFEERLDVLCSGAVDLPERQRTLRATIDWSYRLLLPDEQRLLDRLSLFAGGASIEAVEAVCAERGSGDVLETLSSLLEKSLLLLVSTEDQPRVQLLNTVRVYAAERLAERGEGDAVADRHADWFLQRALLVDPVGDPRAHDRFDVMLRESDDIRAAMDWVLTRRDHRRAAAFGAATWMWFWLRGRLVDVRPWFQEAAELADDPDTPPVDRAFLRYCYGQILEILGDARTSVEILMTALPEFERSGHKVGIAACQLAMAAALPSLGQVEEGYDRAREALRIGEELGEPHLIGYSAAIVGTSRFVTGDLVGAREAHQRTLDAAKAASVQTLQGQALAQMAIVDVAEGDLEGAWQHLSAAATPLRATRNQETLTYWLEFAAAALERRGEHVVGLRALAAADAIRDDLQVVIWPLMVSFHADLQARLTDAVGAGADEVRSAAHALDPWELMTELVDEFA